MLLSYSLVPESPLDRTRIVLLLHGILGRGSNFQTFARRLVDPKAAEPGKTWAAMLPDLRMHGASQASTAPHTFRSVVQDVRELIAAAPLPVEAVIGHSFGGKVAACLLKEPPEQLREIWILDAGPSARGERSQDDVIERVLRALSHLPPRLSSRSDFIARLVASGIDDAIAMWLAKNITREADGLRFSLDLSAIQALLSEHDRTDVWDLIDAHPANIRLRFVLGGRSASVRPSDRARLEALAASGRIDLYVLERAGHWVHADDPEGLLTLLHAELGRARPQP